MDHEKKSDINLGNNPKAEEDYETIVRDKMMAVGLLKRPNKRKFHKLITNIHDHFSFNIDIYPTTIHVSYELLENHSRYDNHIFTTEDKDEVEIVVTNEAVDEEDTTKQINLQ